EDGTVTLIGATTENPSFEVIAPLLSRSRVFRLEALAEDELGLVLERGLAELGATASDDARAALAAGSRGDARVLLNALETAAALAGAEAAIEVEQVQQAPHFIGLPEALFPLTEAALYLARAPKSRAVADAYGAAAAAVKRTGNLPVPLHLRNAVTGLMREMGYGQGSGGFLPPELERERFVDTDTLPSDDG